jgi:bifunctional N-acetylglucosamine-1-phosphate-uridyltransferase/glucosamine-1-phosphate-acetyltransferase GlmU-like protein
VTVTGSSLVVLAAGQGVRFGGVKQLVAVRDDGATITDVLIRRAADAGLERAVIVVRAEIEELMRSHLDESDRAPIPVELAVQTRPRGTADALLSARGAVDGSVVVVNADDLYPAEAFRSIANHLRHASADEHAVVGFRLDRTLIGPRPEARALLTFDEHGGLAAVREGSVEKGDGLQFRTATAIAPLRGDEIVSMNMWGFRPSVFDALATAVAERGTRDPEAEVYLPDVVSTMIAAGDTVRVLGSDEDCIGITYREDLDTVRAAQR